jgi:hypothetical protein
MANTTNYNWETPDDTDLVKDGAAAIRTLGSSVDTTTKALNPSTTLGDIEYRSSTANTNTRLGIGTTGQVLTVAGGVPTWATSDDANAIQNALLTTTGDTIYASGASTPARLGIGTTGQVLTVSAGVPSWATPAGGGGMTLISTTNLSGATTTVGSIPGTYKRLVAVIAGANNSTADGQFRCAPNGITDQSSGVSTRSSSSTAATSQTFSASRILIGSTAQTMDTNNSFVLTIDDYASTTLNKPFFVNGGSTQAGSFWFGYQASGVCQDYTTFDAITSLVFSNSGGNHTAGTVKLYGVN